MTDVFISYKREEGAFARRIASALAQRGFQVWWDADILPGEQYRKRTLEVLRTCRAAIVVWSRESVLSSWVLDEAQRANDRGVLVPVMAEPLTDYPLGFGQLQTHTLVGWDGDPDHVLFKPVLNAVERLVGAGAGAASPPPADAEVAFWRGVQDSRNRGDFEAYLARYPDGLFAALAKARLAVEGAPAAEAQPAPQALAGMRALWAEMRPPFSGAELGFIAAVALLAPFPLWPFVNIAIGVSVVFWGPDFQNLFDFNSAINLYWAAPVLVAAAWGYDRGEALLEVRGAMQWRSALRMAVGVGVVLAFLVGAGRGRIDDGASAHFALWTGSVWLAALSARRLGPRLRALFTPD